jgi:hypothetical protein
MSTAVRRVNTVSVLPLSGVVYSVPSGPGYIPCVVPIQHEE